MQGPLSQTGSVPDAGGVSDVKAAEFAPQLALGCCVTRFERNEAIFAGFSGICGASPPNRGGEPGR